VTEISRRRQASFQALLVSLVVLSALGTSELAGAIVYRRLYGAYHDAVGAYLAHGRNPQPEWIPDSLCHHRPNPAVAHNEVNRHRTRGPDFPLAKAPDELRIVCVGDSTTEGLTLPSDQAYPAFLERFLAEILPGRHVTAINGGVSNHNSAFNLSYLGLSLIHLQPDVVVIKSSYNDYVSYQSSLRDHDYSLLPVYCLHPLPEPPPLWVRLSQWGKVWTARELSAMQKGFGAGQYPLRDASRMTSDEVIDDNLEHSTIYREQILGMVGIARANGAEPVLLDLPLAPDAGPREFVRIVGHFNHELAQVAEKAEVPLVRTADALGANDFLDRCHNYSQGHQRIAARVANQLALRMGAHERWEEVDSGSFRLLDVSGPPSLENDPVTLFDPAPTGYVSFMDTERPKGFVLDLGRTVDKGLLMLSWTARAESLGTHLIGSSLDGQEWRVALREENLSPQGVTIVGLEHARFLRVEGRKQPGLHWLWLRRLNVWERVPTGNPPGAGSGRSTGRLLRSASAR
jgi:lysophospholipase L1-like esterase